MNGRELISNAFEHRTGEQIPSDFGGTSFTSITATALYHLHQCVGSEVPVRVYDTYRCLAELTDSLEKVLASDTLRIPTPVPLLKIECLKEQTKKRWKSYALEDGTPVLIPNDFYPEREFNGDLCQRDFQDRRFALMKRGGYRFEPLFEGPGACGMSLETLESELAQQNPAVRCGKDEAYWNILGVATHAFAKTTQKALVLEVGPPTPFFAGLGTGSPEKWLEHLDSPATYADALLEKWFELWMADLDSTFAATGDSLDVLVLQDDFTIVRAPEDIALIQKRILPFYARGIAEIRKRSPKHAKILWQAPGNMVPFLPQLIEMGVQALGLVDLDAPQMNPLALKKDFGNDIVLWGGACSAKDLLEKSEEAVLRQVQDNIHILATDGGYVHALAGAILPQTAPENVLTYFSRRG